MSCVHGDNKIRSLILNADRSGDRSDGIMTGGARLVSKLDLLLYLKLHKFANNNNNESH